MIWGALAAAATVIALVAVIAAVTVRAIRIEQQSSVWKGTADAAMQRERDEDGLRADPDERACLLRRPD